MGNPLDRRFVSPTMNSPPAHSFVRPVKLSTKSKVMLAYGAAVVASGLFRYLSREGGSKGLWFGLVMGAAAMGSGVALHHGRRALGFLGSAITFAFVGGWFAYEALIKKGFAAAEPRQLAIIALTAVSACALLVRSRGPE